MNLKIEHVGAGKIIRNNNVPAEMMKKLKEGIRIERKDLGISLKRLGDKQVHARLLPGYHWEYREDTGSWEAVTGTNVMVPGPQGPAGPKGEKGDRGENGRDGADGGINYYVTGIAFLVVAMVSAGFILIACCQKF